MAEQKKEAPPSSPSLAQLQESEVKSEFLKAFQIFSDRLFAEFSNQYAQNQPPVLVYDFNAFNKATINRTFDSTGKKDTKERTRGYLAKPEKYEKQIRDVSIYLYNSIQEYKHLIDYMSKMLTHDYILIPDNLDKDFNDKKILNSFWKTLQFIENYNIKSKLSSIESILVREDFYFGYERSDGDNYIWQRLPSDYCRILGFDEFGTIMVEFDFTYFNKRSLAIENFDLEFSAKYNIYKENGSMRWQQLSDKAICFKLDTSVLYGLPYFSGIFTDLMGLEDYKDDQEETNRANNYKLIALKIPIYDKEKGLNQYLVSLDHITQFVSNASRNTPERVGIFAFPGDAEALNLTSATNSHFEENMVSKAQNDLMTSAGVSKLVGNSEKTSIGLERSIQDDEAVMFSLLRQYELWFKKRLKMFNKRNSWKLVLPDISVFNRDKMFDKYLKSGNYGFPLKFFISACLNVSQSGLLGLAVLEEQLGLMDLFKVLPSSATTPGGEGAESGRPEKNVVDKQDSTQIVDDLESGK